MRQKKENKTNIIKTKKELVFFFLTFFYRIVPYIFANVHLRLKKNPKKLTEYENVVQFKMHSSLICSIKTLNVFLKS